MPSLRQTEQHWRDRYAQSRARRSLSADENMLVVLFGLGEHMHPHCTFMGIKRRERRDASSSKLRNYVQIYSTKITHL